MSYDSMPLLDTASFEAIGGALGTEAIGHKVESVGNFLDDMLAKPVLSVADNLFAYNREISKDGNPNDQLLVLGSAVAATLVGAYLNLHAGAYRTAGRAIKTIDDLDKPLGDLIASKDNNTGR